MRSITSRLVAAAATAVAAGLVLASPASAQVKPAVLDIGDGRLVAKGVAVDVPVTFVCEAGQQFDLAVLFTQRVGGRQSVGGQGNEGGTCTGEPETATARVIARDNQVYKKGSGLAEPFLSICTPENGCQFIGQAFSEDIRIR